MSLEFNKKLDGWTIFGYIVLIIAVPVILTAFLVRFFLFAAWEFGWNLAGMFEDFLDDRWDDDD